MLNFWFRYRNTLTSASIECSIQYRIFIARYTLSLTAAGLLLFSDIGQGINTTVHPFHYLLYLVSSGAHLLYTVQLVDALLSFYAAVADPFLFNA